MLRSRRRRYRRRSRRIPRLKGLSIGKLIPNFITVSAVCSGLTGIRCAIEGRWDYAVAAIILAAILDALDGRMARILKASSEFGAQLDSLADIVSFPKSFHDVFPEIMDQGPVEPVTTGLGHPVGEREKLLPILHHPLLVRDRFLALRKGDFH